MKSEACGPKHSTGASGLTVSGVSTPISAHVLDLVADPRLDRVPVDHPGDVGVDAARPALAGAELPSHGRRMRSATTDEQQQAAQRASSLRRTHAGAQAPGAGRKLVPCA